jgi:hypothetical protein
MTAILYGNCAWKSPAIQVHAFSGSVSVKPHPTYAAVQAATTTAIPARMPNASAWLVTAPSPGLGYVVVQAGQE